MLKDRSECERIRPAALDDRAELSMVSDQDVSRRREQRAARIRKRNLRGLVHHDDVERALVPDRLERKQGRAHDAPGITIIGNLSHRGDAAYARAAKVVGGAALSNLDHRERAIGQRDHPQRVVYRAMRVRDDEHPQPACGKRGHDARQDVRLSRSGGSLDQGDRSPGDRGGERLLLRVIERGNESTRLSLSLDEKARVRGGERGPLEDLARRDCGGASP
jgi:hypothetical protein